MAYHDTLSPAQVLNKEITATRKFVSFIGRIFASFGHSMTMAAEARARFETFSALQGKSDEELAKLGLKRDQIARHVFSDLYYC